MKCTFSDSMVDLQNQNFLERDPEVCVLTSSPCAFFFFKC